MKRLALALIALIALMTVLVAGCSSGGGAVKTVDAQTFLDTASQPGVTVVDVRTPAEYAAGHLDGAVNIDVESSDFAQQLGSLDKATTYALYCRSGNRSAAAADQMAAAGFTSIDNLTGGIADLAAAGGQIVT
ncbi:MAG: rhodanese-like domain-containing protein [Candidatus Nanopelagicales bacterium]